jgi:hypothetical protein
LTYLPSIIGAIAAIISASAVVATFHGIRVNQRHNERMQRERFEEDDRIRKRDTLLKTGEELYQLLQKHTKHAPGDLQPPRLHVGAWPPEARSAIYLAREKENEDEAAAWERMETLVRIYHPDLLRIYSELLAGRSGLDHLVHLQSEEASDMGPEDIEKPRRQFREARLGLLHILEQRLRSL